MDDGKTFPDPLLEYQGDATHHSLYAIREEARKFLKRERPDNDPRISVFGPGIRAQFPLCAVPLQMRLRRESAPYERTEIDVSCVRTIVKHMPSWHTIVFVLDPVAHAEWIAKQGQKKAAESKNAVKH